MQVYILFLLGEVLCKLLLLSCIAALLEVDFATDFLKLLLLISDAFL